MQLDSRERLSWFYTHSYYTGDFEALQIVRLTTERVSATGMHALDTAKSSPLTVIFEVVAKSIISLGLCLAQTNPRVAQSEPAEFSLALLQLSRLSPFQSR